MRVIHMQIGCSLKENITGGTMVTDINDSKQVLSISCEASNYWTSPDGKEENAKWTMLERVPGLDWMDNSFDAYVTADRNDMLIAFRYSIYYLIKGHFLWSFEPIEAHRSDQGIAGTIVKQAGDLKIARIFRSLVVNKQDEAAQETMKNLKRLVENKPRDG